MKRQFFTIVLPILLIGATLIFSVIVKLSTPLMLLLMLFVATVYFIFWEVRHYMQFRR